MYLFNFHHHTSYKWGITNLEMGTPLPPGPFSVGLHPMQLDSNWQVSFQQVEELAKSPQCIAIGECGFDRRSLSNTFLQSEVFLKHIQLANLVRKPIIIHCVKMHDLLIKYRKESSVPLILHGFNNKAQTGKMLLDAGFYISFGISLLHNVSLQAFALEVPIERIFLETDDSTVPIQRLYSTLSTLKELSISAVQTQMLKNLQTITDI